MLRFIYNLLLPLGFLFFLPGLLYKLRNRGGWKSTFMERVCICTISFAGTRFCPEDRSPHIEMQGLVCIFFRISVHSGMLQPNLYCSKFQ